MMSEAHSMISFEQSGIGGVLKHYQLAMPANQREYAWTDKEVTTLFQDFSKAISDEEDGYFLGTIVTIPKDGFLEVVDGQQRLATTAILLAAIRDYLKGKENIIAESIENDFLTGVDRVRRERVPRLKLNVDDNDYFRAKLINDGAPSCARSSHNLINDAFSSAQQYVRKIVGGFNEQDHGDILNKWLSFIENKALVILLRVSNEANAYKMFETLNDRGLKTTQSDLVKNYLFGRADSRLEEAKVKWSSVKGILEAFSGDEDITVRFLRHSLIVMQGHVKEANVYEAVQKAAKGSQTAIAILSNFESLANSYAAIHMSDHENWNGYSAATRKAIEVINLFGIKPIRPLMLAASHKFTTKAGMREAEKLFCYLISACVRMLISGIPPTSGSVEIPFSTVANKVFSEEIKTTDEIKKALRDVIPNDEQFKIKFEIATVSNEKLARYYLRAMEMTAKNVKEPWFLVNDDGQVISLEHVLPKKPEGNWPSFSGDEGDNNLKRIGNLALLQASGNSNLKSAPFSEKKAVFKNSPFVLTAQLADVDVWTPQTVSDRQKTLAALALKTWAL